MSAGIITGLIGGMSISEILETLGSTFVANRNMALFIITVPVVAMLEKNGLKLVAENLMKKVTNASPGLLATIYGVVRGIGIAFNVGFGGVVGFIRPVLNPMSEASVERLGVKLEEKDLDTVKAMNAAAENMGNFFAQCLFLAGSGILLVVGTLEGYGYTVDPMKAMQAEIPVFIIAMIVMGIYFSIISRGIMKKYRAKAQEMEAQE
jgi:uncharacterized membrane protein